VTSRRVASRAEELPYKMTNTSKTTDLRLDSRDRRSTRRPQLAPISWHPSVGAPRAAPSPPMTVRRRRRRRVLLPPHLPPPKPPRQRELRLRQRHHERGHGDVCGDAIRFDSIRFRGAKRARARRSVSREGGRDPRDRSTVEITARAGWVERWAKNETKRNETRARTRGRVDARTE
jgi:hypothetical protein